MRQGRIVKKAIEEGEPNLNLYMFWALKGHSLSEMALWTPLEKSFMTAAALVYLEKAAADGE